MHRQTLVKLITNHELRHCRDFQEKKGDQYEPMITISKSVKSNSQEDNVCDIYPTHFQKMYL